METKRPIEQQINLELKQGALCKDQKWLDYLYFSSRLVTQGVRDLLNEPQHIDP